jgi:alpha-D-ribose 1-methylphosphonate 5-triphosphate synthase subunit PhnG
MSDDVEPAEIRSNSSVAQQRAALMRMCAYATQFELEVALQSCEPLPAIHDVRAPQSGLVMLRGRVGGAGQSFNVGEAAVTRAVVLLEGGAQGFAYIMGRSGVRARLAAVVDALGQDEAYRAILEERLARPVRARLERKARQAAEIAAATKVDFFTLVRGEDGA